MAQPSTLLEAPAGLSYRDFIRTWSDTHVARWLTDIKCSSNAATFRENDIRGDIILELDQTTLQEMGVVSIGDRLRILNAVKILRQRCQASKSPSTPPSEPSPSSSSPTTTSNRLARRPGGRPAPLTLHANNKDTLPAVARESPAVRPLPNPTNQTAPNTADSSISSSSGSQYTRMNLPPLPPVPRYQPPLPPANRQPSRAPHNSSRDRDREALTPSSPWSNYHLPADPRPGNPGGGKTPQGTPGPARSTSPLPPAGARSKAAAGSSTTPTPTNNHGRNGSGGSTPKQRSTPAGSGSHPYAAALHPQAPQQQPPNLSPIQEQFGGASTPVTPSAPSHAYSVGRGPFNPSAHSHNAALSLDDLRRKLCKFFLPDEGLTFTIDVDSCAGGVEIIEKVLKKFGKGGNRSTDNDGMMDHVTTEGGGLGVDGWGVYLDEGATDPLSEAELLTVCHAPVDHPTREHPLILRRIARHRRQESNSPNSPIRFSNTKTSINTKRASSISILSGLGVRDPERALEPPSPVYSAPEPSPGRPPAPAGKRPSKLRNFFGQRPPSELITTHLAEYFPNTEKKVLERTARNSMMFRSNTMSSRRESMASFINNPPLPSRFSSSTQGSGTRMSGASPTRTSFSSVVPPPPPEKPSRLNTNVNGTATELSTPSEDGIPRMSLSTEDGRSVELSGDEDHGHDPHPSTSGGKAQLLPPIPFPSESLAESMESVVTPGGAQRMSRASSNASRFSKRMSYMTELRSSKRDKGSDTASMITMDEITKEVENRAAEKEIKKRDSIALSVNVNGNTSDVDGEDWEEVDAEEGGKELGSGDGVPDTPMDEPEKVGEEEEFEADEEEEEEAEEEETDGEEGEGEGESGGIPKRTANKWIKGALIGSGSFGQVFLGMDASTGTLMAVKQVELPSGSSANIERKMSMLSALEHEIELLQDLQHDNIVQYLYSSLEDDCLNIFLEYVPGGSVTALLRNYGAFEETLVKNFVRQILQGLSYLHERGIIHRDIKGANILVDNKGGVKISDFGISKKMDMQALTGNRAHRPSLQGSVFWMAPEVVKQTTHTEKADIWSVGCLVVEMLTGEHPWAQLSQMQAIFKIGSSAKPTIPSDISSEAQDFLSRTFDIDHTARPSAAELLQHSFIAIKKSTK
ncbi:ATP binding [Marasmius crinis-equi]|uniref:mitogen-activated protein kinase kinase kinase n=1 Tax=Marasmius crinis-equi TaxID=585013 RepID=A0ABR3G1H5_9AGAR